MTPADQILHATSVAVDGEGVLIIGPSGSGKSALALELLAGGAVLIADDKTAVRREGDMLSADVPEAIAGLIEARGVGLIQVNANGPTRIRLVVDMGQIASKRLPEPQTHDVLGLTLPCLHKVETAHFPAAVLLYMKGNL